MPQLPPEELMRSVLAVEIFDIPETGDYAEKCQALIRQCHPGATGMELSELGSELAEASIPCTQENRALHGFLHGGAYFTVGDTLTALMCFYFIEDPAERMLTMSASIRYLRPIHKETVIARARLTRHEGKRLDFVCDFINSETGKRAAQARYRYALAVPR